MRARLRFRLAGIALVVGGLTAGLCHVFNFETPRDVAQFAQYLRFSEPIHLLLFAGGVLVLLGWFGQYALQCSSSGALGFTAFVSLFLGVLCGDLLHCILEFSVFPVLSSEVPYALPGLASATYQSTPLWMLLISGKVLTMGGLPAAAFSIYRSHVLPAWSATPFAVSAILWALGALPATAGIIGAAGSIGLYVSMAVLGMAVLWSERSMERGDALEGSLAICREAERPAAQ